METIGTRIYKLRKAKQMTLTELGDKVGVGASTIRKWENGMIKNLRTDSVVSLARALDVTVAYLLYGHEVSEEPEQAESQPTAEPSQADPQEQALMLFLSQMPKAGKIKVLQYILANYDELNA